MKHVPATGPARQFGSLFEGITGLLLAGFLLCACASTPVKTVEYGPPDAPKAVLVAAQSGDFKDAVVFALVDKLNQMPVRTTVKDLHRLRAGDESGFDVLVLINTCIARRPDPAVTEFLAKVRDRSRVIVVTTARYPDYFPNLPGVDAMTAASVMDQSGETASNIAVRVQERL